MYPFRKLWNRTITVNHFLKQSFKQKLDCLIYNPHDISQRKCNNILQSRKCVISNMGCTAFWVIVRLLEIRYIFSFICNCFYFCPEPPVSYISPLTHINLIKCAITCHLRIVLFLPFFMSKIDPLKL